MTRSVSDVDSIFTRQLQRLTRHAAQLVSARENRGNPDWYIPDYNAADWPDGLFSPKLGVAFSRDNLGQAFAEVITKGGVAGDLTSIQLQGDFLAALERAFRSRHQTGIRSQLHADARMLGHSHENGVLTGGLAGYIEHIINMSKGERTPPDADPPDDNPPDATE